MTKNELLEVTATELKVIQTLLRRGHVIDAYERAGEALNRIKQEGGEIGMEQAMVKVNNVPDYALSGMYPHWVVKIVESEAWFYGAYRTEEGAKDCALEVEGLVVKLKEGNRDGN